MWSERKHDALCGILLLLQVDEEDDESCGHSFPASEGTYIHVATAPPNFVRLYHEKHRQLGGVCTALYLTNSN